MLTLLNKGNTGSDILSILDAITEQQVDNTQYWYSVRSLTAVWGVYAPPLLKSMGPPSLQSVTKATYKFQALQKFFSLYKNKHKVL